jgi:putative ABC transport system ATP-binding protein
MIKLINVSKTFGEGESKVEALKETNITLEDNQMISIIGKSGSGKTTLMNLIGALDRPTTGEIYFDDIDITKMNENDLADYRNKTIGYIFQSFYLDEKSSVLNNITMPLVIRGVEKNIRDEEARKYLKLLNMLDKESSKVNTLSGGQKQRVAIARALINNPKVILADEPTGNLDSENGKEVLDLLKEIVKMGKLVILITHNTDDAKKYADKILEMKDGVLKCA